MQSSTQVYRTLKAADFSEPQARALVEILQAAGLVEPESPESELERIEQYRDSNGFQPTAHRRMLTKEENPENEGHNDPRLHGLVGVRAYATRSVSLCLVYPRNGTPLGGWYGPDI
jgi:hypothetical protein